MHSKYILLALLLSFSLLIYSCGGGSSLSGSGSAAYATGTEQLDSGDISDAQSTFCDEVDNGSTDAQLAFGCFLTKFLLLPETANAQDILAALGEDDISVETDILEGVVQDFSDSGSSNFVYTDYSALPLNTILSQNYSLAGYLARILNLLVESDTTFQELIGMIYDLTDDFTEMETLLDIVLDDGNFLFTIPNGTFYTDEDIDVSYNDAKLFIASVKASIVSLSTLAAYDYGLDETKVLNAAGTDFDYEVLVADLNGTGETVNGVTVDEVAFLTMNDESLITGQATRAAEAIKYALDAVEDLNSGAVTELLGESVADENFQDYEEFFSDLDDSISSAGMTEIRGIDTNPVEVDLYTFFNNPPSEADVTAYDPFDYDAFHDTIQIVEAYFRDLLEDVADF